MGPLRTVQQQQQTTTVALCTGGLEFFQGRAEPPPLHRWTARVRRREGLAPMHTDAAWGRRSSKNVWERAAHLGTWGRTAGLRTLTRGYVREWARASQWSRWAHAGGRSLPSTDLVRFPPPARKEELGTPHTVRGWARTTNSCFKTQSC
jgi:hypothetical protein